MDNNDLIQQFCGLTGESPESATRFLTEHEWNLEAAAADFFMGQDEAELPTVGSSSAQQPEPEPLYTGPRTLDGRPAPSQAPASSASAGKQPQRKKGLATLSSLQGGNDDGEDDYNDDKDDEDFNGDDESKRGDLFAGGEKSGLAVQDPTNQGAGGYKKIIKGLLSKAKDNSRPDASEPSSSSRAPHFRGTGMTLGGDGVASRTIPDPRGAPPPNSQEQEQGEPQQFVLHIWEDGFSIDEGELRRFDDPANRAALEMIRNGRAPLHLMNVRMDQPVDVKLQQHQEKWKQLPKKYKPFGGEGHRLGSPVPAAGPSATTSVTAASSAPAPPTNAPTSQTDFAVDPSQPAVNIRIQLPDGSRLPGRFNTTHTVGDMYGFLRRASSSLTARPWVLATTFPNKDHTDHDMILGDMAEFKKGGTAVVKWQ